MKRCTTPTRNKPSVATIRDRANCKPCRKKFVPVKPPAILTPGLGLGMGT